MTTHDIFKNVKGLWGLCLIILAITSCTRDYFVDESNFRLFVPQLKDGTIQSFYVAFHSKDGAHLLTRRVDAPFEQDQQTQQGILRFKIPTGNYTLSCFADASGQELTTGLTYGESYAMPKLLQDNLFETYATDPRVLLNTEVTVYPMGYPGALEPVVADMNDTRRFKGKVTLRFLGLPSEVKRLDIFYKGSSSRYAFGGQMIRSGEQEKTLAGSFERTADMKDAFSLPTNILMPSAGFIYGDADGKTTVQPGAAPAPIEVEVLVYDADGKTFGTLTFTREDFENLRVEHPDQVPTDKDGKPLEELTLYPKQEITITFRGMVFSGVELGGWGSIVTPGDDDIIP